MSLFDRLFASAPPDHDNFWYSDPVGIDPATGFMYGGGGSDFGMRIAAVFSCVRARAEAQGAQPCHLYRRLPNGGKERAIEESLYRLLHDQPNEWQTPFEFFQMLEAHVCLRGNGYAQIIWRNGYPEQLIPLHPDRVTPKRIPGTNRLIYIYSAPDGGQVLLSSGDVFHNRGLTWDGLTGISVISYARRTLALQSAMEDHRTKFFRNDARPSVVIKRKDVMEADAQKNFRESWFQEHGGSRAGGVAILEEGMEIQEVGISGKDAEFLQGYQANILEICRWFGVHPRKVFASSGDSQTYANVEQINLEFGTDTLLPNNTRWEQAIRRDLIPESRRGELFAEFLMDVFLRPDTLTRAQANEINIRSGVLCPNEVRAAENRNPYPGGDKFRSAPDPGAPLIRPQAPPKKKAPEIDEEDDQ